VSRKGNKTRGKKRRNKATLLGKLGLEFVEKGDKASSTGSKNLLEPASQEGPLSIVLLKKVKYEAKMIMFRGGKAGGEKKGDPPKQFEKSGNNMKKKGGEC